MILKIKFKNGEISYSKNEIVIVSDNQVHVVVDGDEQKQIVNFDDVESIDLYYDGNVDFIYPK